MATESILKGVYSRKKIKPNNQETEKTALFKGARCKVCLVKENDHLPTILVNNAGRAYELVKDELAASDRETLMSVMLDTQLHLIGIETVSIGSINVCASTISEIFKSSILANAAYLILSHNHPSGNLEPSREDIAFTKNAIKCGNLLGIRIQDHLVVSSRGFTSMHEQGLIDVNERPS